MAHSPGEQSAVAEVVDDAVELALAWHSRATQEETRLERATGRQLAGLLSDEKGLALAVRFVDEVARAEDVHVAAKVLKTLRGDTGFLGPLDRLMLGVGARLAPLAPWVVVPLARKRLRQLVGHLVVDACDPGLARHLARFQNDGVTLNVNLLGEAVLGEEEAASRTQRNVALLERPDVDYVSVKVSSLASQISTWDTAGTVERVSAPLRRIYRAAVARTPHAFVNLDMEEYRDLDLTIAVFEALLVEPEFLHLEAGIALQAYLPDALGALEHLIEFATRRQRMGGAGIKVRVVKGANLAMEGVEAEVHGWATAPYSSKADVDANYLRVVERALRPDASAVLRLGVASHNLFDVAAAHLLAQRRGVGERLDVEMLQGMSPAQGRVVLQDVGSMVLYTPVVSPKDFDVAVSYLVRRLEENAQPQNFLHAMAGDGSAMKEQQRWFREAAAAVNSTPLGRRRTPERHPIGDRFTNAANSDPALAETRRWAADAVDRDPGGVQTPRHTVDDIDEAVSTGRAAAAHWSARGAMARADVLREAARQLEARRGQLITAMAAEGGKTIDQSDPEVSEAVDFASYYADAAVQLEPGHPMSDGATFLPPTLTLITPPWNFPVAIPIGGVLAALAAGSSVIIKPAHPVPRCTEIAVEGLWAAGVPREVLQVVRTGEGDAGRHLVSHSGVDVVVLTGAIETAELFASWRTGRRNGPRVHAETSGKNALVLTPAADVDLAVADLVKSAFGHAGQKCSAASLAILVGSVGRSQRFRRQLIDAVTSLRVGWPDDVGAAMGPLIEPPEGKLLRALTTLEEGERWLVEPQQLDDSGRLWSPGVKDGVAPGSFLHLTEVFGPVLALMRARDLDEAISWQNATRFGLTGGIHSLDPEEIGTWLEQVEVGNAYVNRGITGAIVRRQPFGGWKDSSVGSAAKAGGPNYVASLGSWMPGELPTMRQRPLPSATALATALAPLVATDEERRWFDASVESDAHAWATEFAQARDETGLLSESNEFRYLPVPRVVVRCEPGTRLVELARVLAAAGVVNVEVRLSLAPTVAQELDGVLLQSGPGRALADMLAPLRVVPTGPLATWVGDSLPGTRVRGLGDASHLYDALASTGIDVHAGPVLANGRRELLTLLREQSISRTLHRFGHVPPELVR
ncbi:MAG: bifunctional proline dehydrogenase/L-glutamate gamma-semialdehyde dehydrogenase [Propionibacteriaceae bacterium]|nr:bifunctional proline dehydrogenase/L-glutamate gamma-semialdehyde dehydrogenase [Propionibacteriaceae bacterium]